MGSCWCWHRSGNIVHRSCCARSWGKEETVCPKLAILGLIRIKVLFVMCITLTYVFLSQTKYYRSCTLTFCFVFIWNWPSFSLKIKRLLISDEIFFLTLNVLYNIKEHQRMFVAISLIHGTICPYFHKCIN